jgi:hypothetical protein
MSIAAEEDDNSDAERMRPRSIRFAALPRQPLDQGRGGAREVWADLDPDLNLRWQLRVVEIKDSTGLLVGPAGTQHHVVGLAGPQVSVGTAGVSRVLRRDEVLPVPSSTVLFERPRLRPPGASSVLVLSYRDSDDPPVIVIRNVDEGAEFAAGAQVIVALRGAVRVDGAEATPGSALLLDSTQTYRSSAPAAHLLTVQQPGFAETDAPTPG